MVPKDIVVFLEPGADPARLACAALLAKRWQAHLIATYVVRPIEGMPFASYTMGRALEAFLESYAEQVAQDVAAARAVFDRLTERRSFTSEWRVSDNETPDELMLHARHAALAVLGPPAAQRIQDAPLGLSERVLFGSGSPCLLVPDGWRGEAVGRRIAIGWNGSCQATRAIAAAMPFLVEAESVNLVVVPQAESSGTYGTDPGVSMAGHLSRHGVPVAVDARAGTDAGMVLVERCAEIDADLLVMGVVGRARFSEFLLGGATGTIMKRIPIPVLVAA
jgi:nucleotide-binding universal stress UspA family protein